MEIQANAEISIKTPQIPYNNINETVLIRPYYIETICNYFLSGKSLIVIDNDFLQTIEIPTEINGKECKAKINPNRLEVNIAIQEMLNKGYICYRGEVIGSSYRIKYFCSKMPIFDVRYRSVFQVQEYLDKYIR